MTDQAEADTAVDVPVEDENDNPFRKEPLKDPEDPAPADDGADIPEPAVANDGDDTGDKEPAANMSRAQTVYKNVSTAAFMSDALSHMIALVVISCVELAQASETVVGSDGTTKGHKDYAISVGAVSLILTLLFVVLFRYKQPLVEKYIPYFALFSVLWWCVAVAITTFSAPFSETGNGYFAVWGGGVVSVHFAQISVSKFKTLLGKSFSKAVAGNAQKRVLMMILLLSAVFGYACLLKFDDDTVVGVDVDNILSGDVDVHTVGKSWQVSFGFGMAIASGVIIAIYNLIKIFKSTLLPASTIKWLSYVLTICWLLTAGITTFDLPFTTTGNGYFTAWGAFCCCVFLAKDTTLNPQVDTPRS